MTKHGSHPQHELHVVQNMENNNPQKHTCSGCKFPLFGTCYACTPCNFYLHKFCFDLPQSGVFEIMHPEHALHLHYPPHNRGKTCDGCAESIDGGFTYGCSPCNVTIHANCAAVLQPQDPENSREQYGVVYLACMMMQVKSINAEKDNKKMEMEAELSRRRAQLSMQQIKRASESIDFMGQIGSSSTYTYRYY